MIIFNDENNIDPNVLLEQRIVTNTTYNMIIEVNPSENYPNFFLDPYFKLYYNSNYRANQGKCSRIAIKEAKFIDHDGSIMHINNKNVSFLIAILNDNYDSTRTVWKYMCDYITDLAIERKINVNYRKLKMPDYNKLKFM